MPEIRLPRGLPTPQTDGIVHNLIDPFGESIRRCST